MHNMDELTLITRKIESLQGNVKRDHGAIYMAPENMKALADFTEFCEAVQDLLITPYLINLGEQGGVYEMYEFEFALSVGNVAKSCFVEYIDENVIPRE